MCISFLLLYNVCGVTPRQGQSVEILHRSPNPSTGNHGLFDKRITMTTACRLADSTSKRIFLESFHALQLSFGEETLSGEKDTKRVDPSWVSPKQT